MGITGLKFEENLKQSIQQSVDVPIVVNAELDHIHKIDFLFEIDNQAVGVQVSLRKDQVKAKCSKVCALEVASRFVYLCLPEKYFRKVNMENGKILFQSLIHILRNHTESALSVVYSGEGYQVRKI